VAQTALPPEARAHELAVWLAAQGDYARAIDELRRWEYETRSMPTVAGEAAFAVGACYQRGQEWERAARAYRYFFATYPQHPRAPEAAFRVIECLFASGQHAEAVRACREYLQSYPGGMFTDDAAFLSALAEFLAGHWKEAAEGFAALQRQHADSPLSPTAARLQAAAAQGAKVRRRSPATALLLSSLLPGAGQVYAGRQKDGLMAFLVNGVFGYLTYDRFRAGSASAAILVLAVEASFYAGNAYGAGNAALSENRRRQEEYILKTMEPLRPQLRTTLGHPERLQIRLEDLTPTP
jgi:TolA-binding protein